MTLLEKPEVWVVSVRLPPSAHAEFVCVSRSSGGDILNKSTVATGLRVPPLIAITTVEAYSDELSFGISRFDLVSRPSLDYHADAPKSAASNRSLPPFKDQ